MELLLLRLHSQLGMFQRKPCDSPNAEPVLVAVIVQGMQTEPPPLPPRPLLLAPPR